MNACHFHNPVMYFIRQWQWQRNSADRIVVPGVLTPLHWFGPQILKPFSRPNYSFPGLDSCFHSWNPVSYCKDPALLGNNRHFMGKLIQWVLCIALGINHMASSDICIVYSHNSVFTQKANFNGGHQASSGEGLAGPLNQPRGALSSCPVFWFTSVWVIK